MKNVTAINQEQFKQAVDAMNKSDLFPVKIELGPELKESTVTVFFENVEAVPAEQEEEIPNKIIEMYNFIFDDEYQIPDGIFEEEIIVEEVKMEDAVDPSTPVPEVPGSVEVKVKKVKEPKAPKAPKEPKEKVVKEFKAREKRDLFTSPSTITRIMMLVCDNMDVSKDSIMETMASEGLKISPATITVQMNDTWKTLTYLKKIGKLV